MRLHLPAPPMPELPRNINKSGSRINYTELMENSVMIDPSIIGGWFASVDGLVIIGRDLQQYTIAMSYESAVENAKFLTEMYDAVIIDRRPLSALER